MDPSRWQARVAAMALLGCACSASPDDLFFIQGRLLLADGGTGAAGAVASFARTAEARPPGIACGLMAPYARVVADSGGTFDYALIRQDTLAPDGQPACFQLRFASGPESGVAEATFAFPGTDVRLPPLVVWTWGLAAESDAQGTTIVRFRPFQPPAWAGEPGVRELPVEHWALVRSTSGVLWQERVGGGTLDVAPEIREDFASPRLTVSAERDAIRAGVAGLFPEAVYVLRQASPELTLTTGSLRPPSRGAPCGTGQAVQDRCPLTDGLLNTWALPPSTHELVLKLPSPTALGRIVVRDLNVDYPFVRLVFEGAAQADGPWLQLGEAPPPSASVSRAEPVSTPATFVIGNLDPGAGEVARVRVRALNHLGEPVPLRSVREVSVFSPR